MIKIAFTICVALAVAAELYVWFAAVRRRSRTFRAVWSSAFILLYAVMLGMMIGFFLPYEPTALTIRVTMWILLAFVLNGTVKLLWTVFDIPARLFRRYGYLSAWATLHFIGIAVSVLAAAAVIWGATAGRSRIRVERVTLTVPDLPQAFDGMRIALFSDLHYGTTACAERLMASLADTIAGLRPDMIVNCGDNATIDYRELDDGARRELSRIQAPLGVYAVLGNHDMGYYIRDTSLISPEKNIAEITGFQEALGWNVLRDRTVIIRRNGDAIAVTGLDYPKALSRSSHSQLAEHEPLGYLYDDIPDSMFRIALSHAPQMWNDILESGRPALTLSGHVHSMQSKIKLFGWRWSPARIMYRRWSGLYEEGDRYLYINDGMGTVMLPARIGARPEVTLITLRR